MHQTATREVIENLIGIVEDINKGGYYIGCGYGTESTHDALRLNWLLNPKSKIGYGAYHFSEIPNDALRGLYSNLTDLDKKRLGIDEKFDRQRKFMFKLS